MKYTWENLYNYIKMESQILWNHNDYEESMISHIDDAVLEERVGESEVNSQNQNLETQTFQSDRSLFDTLARTNNFSEFCTQFQHVALQEGWDVQVDSVRKDSSSSIIVSCMIRCLMYDKNAKRTLANKNNPEKAKRRQKLTKTNCQCRFSIKLVEVEDNNNENHLKWCYEIVSFENNHNHAKNAGFKAKLTDDIELWVKENINP